MDIRGIPTTDAFGAGRLVAGAAPPAGFTVGHRYYPLALGVDCAPAVPVVYLLVADDLGALRAAPAAAFVWAVEGNVA